MEDKAETKIRVFKQWLIQHGAKDPTDEQIIDYLLENAKHGPFIIKLNHKS